MLRPAADRPSVADGRLRLPLAEGALAGPDATARNIVLQHAPAGGWTATARLGVAAADAPGERIGLVLWRAEGPVENAFSTVTFARSGAGAPRLEAVHTDGGVLAIPLARAGCAGPGRDHAAAALHSERVRAAYSADGGASWTDIGEPARIGGAVRVGMLALWDGRHGDRRRLHPLLRAARRADVRTGARHRDARDGDQRDGERRPRRRGRARTRVGLRGRTVRAASRACTSTCGRAPTARRWRRRMPTATSRPRRARSPSSPPSRHARRGRTSSPGTGSTPCWQVRRPVPTGVDVHGGGPWLRPDAGELPGTARNVLLDAAPAGAWTMTTAVDIAALDAPGHEAGSAPWRGRRERRREARLRSHRRRHAAGAARSGWRAGGRRRRAGRRGASPARLERRPPAGVHRTALRRRRDLDAGRGAVRGRRRRAVRKPGLLHLGPPCPSRRASTTFASRASRHAARPTSWRQRRPTRSTGIRTARSA